MTKTLHYPNGRTASQSSITLPGGLLAVIEWDDEEGQIRVDPTWAANSPHESIGQRQAIARAQQESGRDDIPWHVITA